MKWLGHTAIPPRVRRAAAALRRLLFPLTGLAALLWFVVRVVPKPSRAGYPCQRAAAPLASGFLLWLLGGLGVEAAGGRAGWRPALRRLSPARPLVGLGGALLALAGLSLALSQGSAPARAGYAPHPANQPIGVARGLWPGRVAWVYDSSVTDWAGPGTGERWYDHVDQAAAARMVSAALRTYAGQPTDAAAWQALFRHFNGGASGYTPGEKVLIKINLTTANARTPLADEQYHQLEGYGVSLDSTANAPQLLAALLDQLVNVVGVAQADIAVGDPTGLFVDYLYDPLHASFPDVVYYDNRGTLGRSRAEFGSEALHWSTPEAAGTTLDYLPLAYQQATYLINFALLKSHQGAGLTAAAKNHYGSLLRCPDGYLRDAPNAGPPPYNGYYHLHDTLPGDGYRDDPAGAQPGHYRALVDLMGHAGLGGKTLLYLVDGLFGGRDWNSVPSTWALPPFDDGWPSSLFLSMDPVAIDSVARDFAAEQWPDQVLSYEGVEDYLHEAALADNPPSGTFYDPEGDGTPLASLGVHEHWNNPTDKQYSRNLGSGDGIELVTSSPLLVTLWHAYSGDEQVALEEAIAAFEADNPGLSVAAEYHHPGSLRADFEAAVPAGSGPELLLGPAEWGPELYDAGLLADLSSLAGPELLASLQPVALPPLRWRAALIGLPHSLKGVLLFRNTEIITAAAATYPDLVAAAQAASGGGIDGAYLERGFFYAAGHLYGLGGELMDGWGCPAFNTATGVAWVDLLDSFGEAGPTGYYTDADLFAFLGGTVGLIVDGSWHIASVASALGAEKAAVDPWPTPLSGYVQVEPVYMSSAAAGDERQAAWALAEFLLSPQAQQILLGAGHLPAIRDLAIADALLAQAEAALASGVPYRPIPQLAAYWEPMDAALTSVFDGAAEPGAALEAAHDAIVAELSARGYGCRHVLLPLLQR